MTESSSTRLYAITPPRIALKSFVPQVEEAFKGGDIGCLQLRLKEASDAEIIEAGKALAPVCAAHEAAFILNDRPDLVAECGADGVHLGQEDLSSEWIFAPNSAPCTSSCPDGRQKAQEALKVIRRRLGEEAVIGVTCHASRHLAMEAGEEVADYVAFGAFFPTVSKPKEKLEKWGMPEIELLEWWSAHSLLPCVAIGGITPRNLTPLVRAGADFVAAITGIWDHPEGSQAAVREYNRAIEEAVALRGQG